MPEIGSEIIGFDYRRVDHPPTRVPVLEHWQGIYDHVFVVQHPFFRIPEPADNPTPDAPPVFGEPVGWSQRPDDFHQIVKDRGEPVSWSSVHAAAAPEVSREAFGRATSRMNEIGAKGDPEGDDVALQKRIADHCAKERIYPPSSLGMPFVLEHRIGEFLGQFGVEKAEIWNVFRDHFDIQPLGAFARGKPCLEYGEGTGKYGVHAILLREPGVLFSWEAYHRVALLALTDRALVMARPEAFFEGRYADAATTADVFNAGAV